MSPGKTEVGKRNTEIKTLAPLATKARTSIQARGPTSGFLFEIVKKRIAYGCPLQRSICPVSLSTLSADCAPRSDASRRAPGGAIAPRPDESRGRPFENDIFIVVRGHMARGS